MTTFNLNRFLNKQAEEQPFAPVQSSPTSTIKSSPLDGKRNDQAARFVNNLIFSKSKNSQGGGFFSDSAWQGIYEIRKALQEAGLDVDFRAGVYHNYHSSNLSGPAPYKEWKIAIPFKNNSGRDVTLVGNIIAHSAGTTQDPFSRYDITGQVSAVATKKLGESMATFNLQKHINKIASNLVPLKKEAQSSYEGAQGYFVAQTRSWQNCVRRHMLKGESAQEAWQNALDEYQKTANNTEWISKNCVEDTLELQKKANCGGGGMLQMGSYLEKIKKHKAEGMSIGQSVMASLKDCEREAAKIREAGTKGNVKTANFFHEDDEQRDELFAQEYCRNPIEEPEVVIVCPECKREQEVTIDVDGSDYTPEACDVCHRIFTRDERRNAEAFAKLEEDNIPSEVYKKERQKHQFANRASKLKTASEVSGAEIYQEKRQSGESPEKAAEFVLDVLSNGEWVGWSKVGVQDAIQKIIAKYETSVKTASKNCQYELGGFQCCLKEGHAGNHSNPDYDSMDKQTKTACKGCGCGSHGNSHKCECPAGCDCKKDGGTCCKNEKIAFSKDEIRTANQWIQEAVPASHEGKFEDYCKGKGHEGVCQECIDEALSSGGHPAKMANFAINVSKGKYHHPETKASNETNLTVEAKKKKNWNPNPWAVCEKSVGSKEDPEKFERCVKEVKKKQD